MSIERWISTMGLALVMTGAAIGAPSQAAAVDLDAVFQGALFNEQVQGDLHRAITGYEQVVNQGGANRSLVAKALLRMAHCYEALGDDQARSVYQRILTSYGDQTDTVKAARDALAGLQTTDAPFKRRLLSTDGFGDATPEFSADGRVAYFAKRVGSSSQIESSLIARDLSSNADRVVMSGIKARIVWIGPDPTNRRIAVRVTKPPAPGAKASPADSQFLMVPTISGPGAITDAAGVTWMGKWSPDGRWYSFAALEPGEAVAKFRLFDASVGRSVSTGVEWRRQPHFQWSPSGDRLALIAKDASGAEAVQILTAATGERKTLPLDTHQGDVALLGPWTAQGIVLEEAHATVPITTTVGLLSAETGQRTSACSTTEQVPGDLNVGLGGFDAKANLCLNITADGRSEIVWKVSSRRIEVRDLASGKDHPLTSGAGGDEYHAGLSPDGRVEVMASNREGAWALYAVPLDRTPVGRPVRIATFDLGLPVPFRWLGWSQDAIGADLAYAESNIWRVAMDPTTGHAVGPLERLTHDTQQNLVPDISPDNSHIAYKALWSGRASVAVMDANGANERIVASDRGGPSYLPALWRSAEDVIVAERSALSSAPAGAQVRSVRVWSLNTRTTAFDSVTSLEVSGDGSVKGFDFSRARNEIVYVAGAENGGPHTFRAYSLVDKTDRVLVSLDAGEHVFDFKVTPDGSHVAFVLRHQNPQPPELIVLTIATGERRTVNRQFGWLPVVGFSPNGRFLLYGDDHPRIMDMTSGDSWPLIQNGAEPDWNSGQGVWSPDGTFIATVGGGPTKRELLQWLGVSYDAVVAAIDRAKNK